MPKKGKKTSKKNKQPDRIKLNEILSQDEAIRLEEHKMFVSECRLNTFKDWPLDEDNACNPSTVSSQILIAILESPVSTPLTNQQTFVHISLLHTKNIPRVLYNTVEF